MTKHLEIEDCAMPRRRISVLDHGFVRLVDSMGNDLSIIRNARGSYDAAWRAGEDEKSDKRLMFYLWRNQHTTPFEAVTFTFEVAAPIFVFRQWQRHRTQSYNELSARYKELPEVFYLPELDKIGFQDKKNKQGREISDESHLFENEDRECLLNRIRIYGQNAFFLYHQLLENGWPRELARIVLPLGTYSHMFTTMNLLNLFKFLRLRDDPHAQYEIQVYAKAIKDLIRPIVPVAMMAFEEIKS